MRKNILNSYGLQKDQSLVQPAVQRSKSDIDCESRRGRNRLNSSSNLLLDLDGINGPERSIMPLMLFLKKMFFSSLRRCSPLGDRHRRRMWTLVRTWSLFQQGRRFPTPRLTPLPRFTREVPHLSSQVYSRWERAS